MKILSIDQSYTHTGICLTDDGKITHTEVISTPKEDDIYLRAYNIKETISWLCEIEQPDIVAIEGLSFGSVGNATRNLAGLLFAIMIEMQVVKGRDVRVIAPPTVKKVARETGLPNKESKKMSKKDMFDALPQDIKDYLKLEMKYLKTKGLTDVVDAYWINVVVQNQ